MKTLFLDIETSPNITFSWQQGFKKNIPINMLIKERAIILISYAINSGDVKTIRWDNKKQCDKQLLKKISKIINDADEIVTQNGDKFDIKFINGRLAFHGLQNLMPIASSDTLKMARRVFYLNSYKLDYLGEYFGLGRKIDTGGFDLWKSIMLDKCEKSMNKMQKYCEQDVALLRDVYEYICQYTHSNAPKGDGDKTCPNCRNESLEKNGWYTSAAGFKYRRFRCRGCGFGSKRRVRG